MEDKKEGFKYKSDPVSFTESEINSTMKEIQANCDNCYKIVTKRLEKVIRSKETKSELMRVFKEYIYGPFGKWGEVKNGQDYEILSATIVGNSTICDNIIQYHKIMERIESEDDPIRREGILDAGLYLFETDRLDLISRLDNVVQGDSGYTLIIKKQIDSIDAQILKLRNLKKIYEGHKKNITDGLIQNNEIDESLLQQISDVFPEEIEFYGNYEELAKLASYLNEKGFIKGDYWKVFAEHFKIWDDDNKIFKTVDGKKLCSKLHDKTIHKRKKINQLEKDLDQIFSAE